ncbi:MAG: leucine-rich repeat domain-containing protein [Muribaculaceae bacterium]|nr:leucine-rich repeat domain-containing protein [Muribaculaceae bacterium]
MLRYIISLFILIISLAVRADKFEVSAGDLHSLVTKPAEVKTLELTGEVNAMDLKFIETELASLESLDLSAVKIVESAGSRIGIAVNFRANTIPANIFAGARFNSVILPATPGLVIEAGAFAGSSLREVVIPATVASVGDGAFLNCPELKIVTISSENLGASVFSECPSLEKVDIRVKTAVPDGAFFNCAKLTSVAGSENITAIGARAFAGCKTLGSFGFGPDLAIVGDSAFDGSGLDEVSLEKSRKLSSVGAWAFANMPNLETLHLGDTPVMGEGVAFNCPGLRKLTVNNVTEIPAYAYAKDAQLDSVGILPVSTESIGDYALSDLSSLTDLTVPVNVSYIGTRAMQRMTSLRHMWVHSGEIPELGDDVWAGVSQKDVQVSVPEHLVSLYTFTPQWQEFTFHNISSVDDIVDDGDVAAGLKARFEGYELQVSVDGVDIETLGLYDTSGMLLVYLEPADGFVAIDTADFAGQVFIVSAVLADGRQASAKLARR